MSEHKDKIMYLGMVFKNGSFHYQYVQIKEDNSLGTEWNFNEKLFSKGTTGAVYVCTFKGSRVSYNKKYEPYYFLSNNGESGNLSSTRILFEELINQYKELNRQAELEKKMRTADKFKIDEDIDSLKKVYRELNNTERSRFIAEIIYKITK